MRQLKTKRKPSGMTLIEMLLYSALLSFLIVILTNILLSTLELQTQTESNSAVVDDGRYILSRLVYEINRASAISTPASIGNQGATLGLTIGGITNTFSLSSGNLVRVDGVQSLQLNSNDTQISSLNFQKLGSSATNQTIRISITVRSRIQKQGGYETKSYTTTVGLKPKT